MARPSKYVSRFDLGWGTSPAASADPRSGLVVHYDSSNQNLADKDHSACLTYWRNTRAFHTGPSRGWVDIGYSWLACAHGYVIDGRGPRREQAAQPGGNRTHYSVTLATGPTDTITDAQINAVRELRQWLVDDYTNAGTVLGHRDFIATSCPGDRAYSMVRDGTFTQAPGPITGGEGSLLGLKEGDGLLPGAPVEGVKAVQRLIVAAGFGSTLAPDGVDGRWGPATSEGLLQARQYVGSGVTSIRSMTGESYAQLIRACARREAERAVGALDVPVDSGDGR
ncbi:peptidoglycan recognition protein family protein [Nocardiopsis prasina]|uniref:peptidoglycan recognition protein family protein n=1 Tax=Nocardiopsis prasina TaxID=2015 RepID=UPI0003471BD1|nr:peptidoglycan recognition family protein [Nocardiopsis prasina]